MLGSFCLRKPEFLGKTVLITGASSGIGAALAVEFARAGADVALLARRQGKLGSVARQIRGMGRKAIALRCDICRDWEVRKAVEESRRRLGRIDIVVANAGIAVKGRLEDLSLDFYRRQFEVNVFGMLRTVYAVLDHLEESRGTLVLMGSVAGHMSCPTASAYSMSKFAVHGLALALMPELASRKITVTHVSPGYVQSEINTGTLPENLRVMDSDPRKMPAEKAARLILSGIHSRKRQVTLSFKGKFKVWFPGLMSWLKIRGESRVAKDLGKELRPGSGSKVSAARTAIPWISKIGRSFESIPIIL